jgi:hypothetical protein
MSPKRQRPAAWRPTGRTENQRDNPSIADRHRPANVYTPPWEAASDGEDRRRNHDDLPWMAGLAFEIERGHVLGAPASLDRRHVVAYDWLAERLVRVRAEQRGRATRRVLSCRRPQRRRRQPT